MSPQNIASEESPARDAVASRTVMTLLPRPAGLLQLCALVLVVTLGAPALGADSGAAVQAEPTATQSDATADDEDDDDDAADYPDDGSGALGSGTLFPVPGRLLPISPTEEKGLLGNWGDSAAEAED